jgi:hypothetical protein
MLYWLIAMAWFGLGLPERGWRVTKTASSLMLEELRSLTGNIEHIKVIVNAQQANARRNGIFEMLPLAKLMEDAIKMSEVQYGLNYLSTFV